MTQQTMRRGSHNQHTTSYRWRTPGHANTCHTSPGRGKARIAIHRHTKRDDQCWIQTQRKRDSYTYIPAGAVRKFVSRHVNGGREADEGSSSREVLPYPLGGKNTSCGTPLLYQLNIQQSPGLLLSTPDARRLLSLTEFMDIILGHIHKLRNISTHSCRRVHANSRLAVYGGYIGDTYILSTSISNREGSP